jgi:hypothetical protein
LAVDAVSIVATTRAAIKPNLRVITSITIDLMSLWLHPGHRPLSPG